MKTNHQLQLNRRQFLQQSVSIATLLVINGCSSAPAPTATSQPVTEAKATATALPNHLRFVSPSDKGSFMYDFDELVLTEAFKRLGYTMELEGVPPVRAIELVEHGDYDGDASRILSFGQSHPKHVLVDAPTHTLKVMTYAIDPKIQVTKWEALKAGNYRVGYLRGVKILEDNLTPLIDPALLFGVDSLEIGFRTLLNRRIDVYISASQFDTWNALQLPEFQGQPLLEAGILTEFQLYPYLHKKHADLAPQLAKTINAMRAEGVLDTYFSQLETKHFKQK